MKLKTSGMDMLHGPLAGKLLLFTLPIALSSMVQQLFNAADTAVVGYWASKSALAAVGTNTEIIALIVTLSSGLSIGANILIANQIGRDKTQELPSTVRTAMLLAVLLGIIGLLLGQAAAPLLRLIQTPEDIFGAAELYLRIYMAGYPFLLLYDFGAAALRARGDSRYPFLALLVSGAANVGLNLLLVIVFRMGVAGVAIATDLSTMLSALLVLHRLAGGPLFRFTLCRPEFSLQTAWHILKTGVPSAVQGAVFCFANIFVQASVNRFGETAIAGSTITMNFEYFTYYIITAFGQTAPPSPARTTPPDSGTVAGEFYGSAWGCQRFAALFPFLRSSCSETFSPAFLHRKPLWWKAPPSASCAFCSLSRSAISMRSRPAFCGAADTRCTRPSAP